MKKQIFGFFSAVLILSTITPVEIKATTTANAPSFTPITGKEMMKKLSLGLNLWGYFSWKNYGDLSGLSLEFAGQGVKAAPQQFKFMAERGFTFVRFQVCWAPHLDKQNNIDKAWLDRVEEVINYALDAGLYVILNAYYGPDEKDAGAITYNEVWTYLSAIWQQTAERFKSHSERLIFDIMNEPHSEGWDVGSDASAVVNRLNADALKIIRKSGGYNKKRVVLLPTAGASTDSLALQHYVFPNDKYCMASIHSYTPWWFCLGEEAGSYSKRDKNHAQFSDKAAQEIYELFRRLKQMLTSRNIPFVMGETGAVNKNNLQERLKWVDIFMSEAGKAGMPTGIHSDVLHYRVFDYASLQWTDPEYLNAIFDTYKTNKGISTK